MILLGHTERCQFIRQLFTKTRCPHGWQRERSHALSLHIVCYKYLDDGDLANCCLEGEELTIKFESQNGPFAIRTFASGVNILSRETPDSIEPGQVHLEISHRDYCIVPGQVFLDGIMQSDGSAKQIVTRPVEPHARGKDQFDGLQFEVIPSPSCLLDMNRWTPLNTEMTVCRNPAPPQAQTGKTDLSDGHSDCFSITINFLASGKAEIFKVRGTTKTQALKRALVELKDVPFMALRLFHGKTQLEDGMCPAIASFDSNILLMKSPERTLQSYGITQVETHPANSSHIY